MVPPDFRSKALKKSVGVMDRGFGKGLFSTGKDKVTRWFSVCLQLPSTYSLWSHTVHMLPIEG